MTMTTIRAQGIIILVGIVVLVGMNSRAHAECRRAIHTFCGVESSAPLQSRVGYGMAYDEIRLVPHWVAYRITPDGLRTPERDGRFASFLVDPVIPSPIRHRHYTGVKEEWGYVRGHLAPWKVMGGDRDDDGQYAHLDRTVSDADEELRIREVNYMTNIAPQQDAAFNGQGGLWGRLERWIQDTVVEDGDQTVWVVAGTIFGPGETQQVMNPNLLALPFRMHVPPMFFKVVIKDTFSVAEPAVLAFLFPHQHVSHGEIDNFLVSVDIIEAMTGLNFFTQLSTNEEAAIERTDTCTYWNASFTAWWHPFSNCD